MIGIDPAYYHFRSCIYLSYVISTKYFLLPINIFCWLIFDGHWVWCRYGRDNKEFDILRSVSHSQLLVWISFIFFFSFFRCEAFSTYPRTYDLLHAWKVFSDIDKRNCGVEDLLIEMDRILRPEGFVIIRDKSSVINYIRKYLLALRWDGWSSEVEPRVDSLSSSEERVFIVRKKLWAEGVNTMWWCIIRYLFGMICLKLKL